MSARFLAVYPRAPGSKAWANAVATVTKCTLLCLCAYSSAVHAADWTVSGIVGTGNRVNLTGVEAQAASGFGGTLADRWSWSLLWSGDVAYWRARTHEDSASSLWETGVTPVIELRRWLVSGGFCYIDAGIGVHLLSHTRIDERQLSTAFQFGELVGAGVILGDRGQYGVGARIQHISNGSIKEPNDGVTFGELRISYRWD